MRFDFSCDHKLTDEEKKQTEDLVNKWINEDLPVVCKEMKKEDAIKSGAECMFIEKYPDIVTVYEINSVNDYQRKELENILRPRNGFHFLVYKDGLTYDDKDNGEDLNLDDVFNLVGTALENADALSNKLA